MSTELSIKNAEGSFLALKSECESLEKNCQSLTITDEISLKIASQQYSLLKAKIKDVEDLRLMGRPFWDAYKQINALADKLSSPMEATLDAGRKKVLAYNNEQKAKAVAEQNRINAIKGRISKYSADAIAFFDKATTEAELTRYREMWIVEFPMDCWSEFIEEAKSLRITLNDYAKNKRIAINTPAESDPETEVIIKEAIEEAVAEVGAIEIEKAVYVAPKNISGKFIHEVMDLSLVPREYLMLDDSLVKKFIKENSDQLHDGMIQSGIKFVWVENVRIK